MSIEKISKWMQGFSAVLVFGLAAAAFALSFEAVRLEAVRLGVNPAFAWLYPVIVDGAIVVFSLAVVRAKLNKEPTRYNWALIVAATVVSLLFNGSHAWTNGAERDPVRLILAIIMAVLPPLALAFGFHSLMDQLERSVLRSLIVRSLAELHGRVQELTQEKTAVTEQMQAEQARLEQTQSDRTAVRAELDELNASKTAVQSEVDALVERLERLEADEQRRLRTVDRTPIVDGIGLEPNDETEQPDDMEAAVLVYLSEHPDASYQDVADHIGRAKSTAGGYIKQLIEDGRLHKNGNGYEVLEGVQS